MELTGNEPLTEISRTDYYLLNNKLSQIISYLVLDAHGVPGGPGDGSGRAPRACAGYTGRPCSSTSPTAIHSPPNPCNKGQTNAP